MMTLKRIKSPKNIFALALFTAIGLTACASGSKSGANVAAKAANSTIDGTATTLEQGTGLVSDIDNKGVRSVTKSSATNDASNPVGNQNFKDATLSPLSDVNIRRREAPELLKSINTPYDPIPDSSCAGLGALVAELDAVLGPDLDVTDEELAEQSKFKERSRDVSIAGVSAAAGLFLPGRGVLREATGAGPRDRAIRAEYRKGLARRSYLKGIGSVQGCAAPAAP